MEHFSSVAIPAFPYFWNLVVFPSHVEQDGGESSFHILKKTSEVPRDSGLKIWVEYIPNSIYCLLPSTERKAGKVSVYSSMPEYLKGYGYCLEIKKKS